MHTSPSSWFTDEERAGLPDFGRVYDAHYFALGDAAVEKMRDKPEFDQLLSSLSFLSEGNSRSCPPSEMLAA